MKPTPKQTRENQFGQKEKLVEKIVPLIGEGGREKKELRKKLLHVSNKKLLRLYEVGTAVKEKFGSKKNLIDAICHLMFSGRKVDEDYRQKLETWSIKRLLDRYQSLYKSAERTQAR